MDERIIKDYLSLQENVPYMFQHYLRRINFNPNGNPSVLSVGCGSTCIAEFVALSNIYRETFGLELDFYGIDYKESRLKDAKEAIGDVATFKVDDARYLSRVFSKFKKFPLVIVRFPEIEDPKHRGAWFDVMKAIGRILAPNGVIFATHANARGLEGLRTVCTALGFSKIIDEGCKYPGRMLKHRNEEIGQIDKYVLIAKVK